MAARSASKQQYNLYTRAGRPTKCTPDVIASVCRCISEGLPYRDAARIAGVNETSITEWRARGEKGEEPFKTFVDALTVAVACFKQTHLGTIRKASKKSWTAAAWLLERRFPEEFALRTWQKTEHTGLKEFVEAFDRVE